MVKIRNIDKAKIYLIEHMGKKPLYQIANDLKITYSSLWKRMKEWNINHHPKYKEKPKFNENYFENIDNEHKAYWFGFLMADGCVFLRGTTPKVCLELSIKDKNHLSKFCESLLLKKKLKILKRKGRKNSTVRIDLYSRKICSDLTRVGCIPNKSLILQFPQVEDRLLWHFIRGYFDGDGSVYIKNKTYGYIGAKFVGSKDFLLCLSQILDKYGINPNNIYRDNGEKIHYLCLSSQKDIAKLYQLMYYNSSICLERKKSVFRGLSHASIVR